MDEIRDLVFDLDSFDSEDIENTIKELLTHHIADLFRILLLSTNKIEIINTDDKGYFQLDIEELRLEAKALDNNHVLLKRIELMGKEQINVYGEFGYDSWAISKTDGEGHVITFITFDDISQDRNLPNTPNPKLISSKLQFSEQSIFVTKNDYMLQNRVLLKKRYKNLILDLNQCLIVIGQLLRDKKLFATIFPNYFINPMYSYYEIIANLLLHRLLSINSKNSNFPVLQASVEIHNRFAIMAMLFDNIFIEETKRRLNQDKDANNSSLFRKKYLDGGFELILFNFDAFMIWTTAIFDNLAWLISKYYKFNIQRQYVKLRVKNRDDNYTDLGNKLIQISADDLSAKYIFNTINDNNDIISLIHDYRNEIAHNHRPTTYRILLMNQNSKIADSPTEQIQIKEEKIINSWILLIEREGHKIWPAIYHKKDKELFLKPQEIIVPIMKKIIFILDEVIKTLYPGTNYLEFFQEDWYKSIATHGLFFPPFEQILLPILIEPAG